MYENGNFKLSRMKSRNKCLNCRYKSSRSFEFEVWVYENRDIFPDKAGLPLCRVGG